MATFSEKNEIKRISRWRKVALWATISGCGLLYTAALPPLNWSVLAFFAFVPLFFIGFRESKKFVTLAGFGFGWLWAFTAFFFLREIQGSMGTIPYMIATIFACYFAMLMFLTSLAHKYIRLTRHERTRSFEERQMIPPRFIWYRELFFALVVASLYIMLEWGRSLCLPWNYLAITQYKNLALLQIGCLGGTYIVSFTIIFVNITLAMAIDTTLRDFGAARKRRIPWLFTLASLMIVASGVFGVNSLRNGGYKVVKEVRMGLVQGDISQRRAASREEAQEALDIYFGMLKDSELLANSEIILLPESATPIGYSSSDNLSQILRWNIYSFVEKSQLPLLIGVVDYELDKDAPGGYKSYNRALLFRPNQKGRAVAKFDKIQRVPFGEFIPFRNYLPKFLIDTIDLGRDLSAGSDYNPIELLDGVHAGMSICFEDVFPYVSRGETLRGANLLVVISNDAWYPESSEPEQHLANALMRCIETGLPMVRCGNNASSIVLNERGQVVDGIRKDSNGKIDSFNRFRGTGVVRVPVPLEPKETFFVKYGNWFQYACAIMSILGVVTTLFAIYNDRKKFNKDLSARS